MVRKREMRGQPGKKVGCPDRQWMLEGSSIGLLQEERNCSFQSPWSNGLGQSDTLFSDTLFSVIIISILNYISVSIILCSLSVTKLLSTSQ